MTTGRSGFPKFRQFVIASGVAPVTATLRAASATACRAPRYGSSAPYRPFPSLESAKSTGELSSASDRICVSWPFVALREKPTSAFPDAPTA